jgi:hypothetical protein
MINTTNDQYPALDRITRITTVTRAGSRRQCSSRYPAESG